MLGSYIMVIVTLTWRAARRYPRAAIIIVVLLLAASFISKSGTVNIFTSPDHMFDKQTPRPSPVVRIGCYWSTGKGDGFRACPAGVPNGATIVAETATDYIYTH